MSYLAPDLLAECVIHVRHDGTYQINVSKLPPDPALPQKVVQAVIGAGFELARMYGIQITKAEVRQA